MSALSNLAIRIGLPRQSPSGRLTTSRIVIAANLIWFSFLNEICYRYTIRFAASECAPKYP